jgi:hypothetical protein
MRLMGRVKYGKPLAIPYNYQKQLVLFIATKCKILKNVK